MGLFESHHDRDREPNGDVDSATESRSGLSGWLRGRDYAAGSRALKPKPAAPSVNSTTASQPESIVDEAVAEAAAVEPALSASSAPADAAAPDLTAAPDVAVGEVAGVEPAADVSAATTPAVSTEPSTTVPDAAAAPNGDLASPGALSPVLTSEQQVELVKSLISQGVTSSGTIADDVFYTTYPEMAPGGTRRPLPAIGVATEHDLLYIDAYKDISARIVRPNLVRSPSSGRSDGDVLAGIDERFGVFLDEATAEFGIDRTQLMAIMAVESRGDPTASSGAAFGLMQVTKGTWSATQQRHASLADYDFTTYWTDPRVNIRFGAAVLKDKMAAVGVEASDPNFARLAVTAYNGGEGVVNTALELARAAGSANPTADCLKPEFLRPAIARYPSVYSYYLTGAGKKYNAALATGGDAATDAAVELKYKEISQYPDRVERYLSAAVGVVTHPEASDDPDAVVAPAKSGGSTATGPRESPALAAQYYGVARALMEGCATYVPYTDTYLDLDEVKLGTTLSGLFNQPGIISNVFKLLSWNDRDDVAFHMAKALPDAILPLVEPSLLGYLHGQLSSAFGYTGGAEAAQATRLARALGQEQGTAASQASSAQGEAATSATPGAPIAPPVAGAHLTEAGCAEALAYYSENRNRYVSGVIMAIERKVGLPDSGQVTAAFCDGVAGYQSTRGLPADGKAGKGTLERMFGVDIRMGEGAVDPALVSTADGLARINSGVELTPAILDGWTHVLPYLPEGAVMTSGVRTWEKTVQILVKYVLKKEDDMVRLGLTTHEEVKTAIDGADFGTLKRLANLDYDKNGDGAVEKYVVAGPGASPHITGLAFDLSGASLTAIDGAVRKAAAEIPAFTAKFKGTIVETGNNCVHVDLQ